MSEPKRLLAAAVLLAFCSLAFGLQIIKRGTPYSTGVTGPTPFLLANSQEEPILTGIAGAAIDTSQWPCGPVLLSLHPAEGDYHHFRDLYVNEMDVSVAGAYRVATVSWPVGGAAHVLVNGPTGLVVSGWRTSPFQFTAPEAGRYTVQVAPSGRPYSAAQVDLIDYAAERLLIPYYPRGATAKTRIAFSWDKHPLDRAYYLQISRADGTPVFGAYIYDSVHPVTLNPGAYRWRATPFGRPGGQWTPGQASHWQEFTVDPTLTAGEGSLGVSPIAHTNARSANLFLPEDALPLPDGSLLVTDTFHHVVKHVDGDEVRVIAGTGVAGYNGDGPAGATQLNSPTGLAALPDGRIVLADTGNYLLRILDLQTETVITLLGNPQTPGNADANMEIVDQGAGWIKLVEWHDDSLYLGMYFANVNRAAVYRYDGMGRPTPVLGTTSGVRTVLGFGFNELGMVLGFNPPAGPAQVAQVYKNGTRSTILAAAPPYFSNILVVPGGTFYFGGHTALMYWDGRQTQTVASGFANLTRIRHLPGGQILALDGDGSKVVTIDPASGAQTPIADDRENPFAKPTDIAMIDAERAYVLYNDPPQIFSHNFATGETRKVAGDGRLRYATPGNAWESPLYYPASLAASPAGDLFVSEQHGVLRISRHTGYLSRYAGDPQTAGFVDGPRRAARFRSIRGLSVASNGSLLVSDTYNNRLRIEQAGQVATLAGNGEIGQQGDPYGGSALAYPLYQPRAAIARPGGGYYVAQSWRNTISFITGDGLILPSVGADDHHPYQGMGGYAEGPRLSARLNTPTSLDLLSPNEIVFSDQFNHRIRYGSSMTTTLFGDGRVGYTPTSLNLPSVARVFTLNGQRRLAIADTGNGLVRSVPLPDAPLRP